MSTSVSVDEYRDAITSSPPEQSHSVSSQYSSVPIANDEHVPSISQDNNQADHTAAFPSAHAGSNYLASTNSGTLSQGEGPASDQHHHMSEHKQHGSEQAKGASPPLLFKTEPSPSSAESSGDEDEDKDGDRWTRLEDRVKKAPKRLNQYSKYVQLMEDRMSHLEEKFRKLETRGMPVKVDEDKGKAGRKPAIPELRYVNWVDFKNKFVEDEKVYAIEALVGEARFWYQRRNDQWMRNWRGNGDQATSADAESTQNSAQSHQGLPERIRISSLPLLTMLSNICSEDWSLKPRVLRRPYKLLVQYDAEIREVFSRLDSKWAEQASFSISGPGVEGAASAAHPATSVPAYLNDITKTVPTNDCAEEAGTSRGDEDSVAAKYPQANVETDLEVSDDLVGSREALRDIQCLIGFMDRHLTPIVEQFQKRTRRHVEFHELWYLFKPGDFIYMPKTMDQVRPGAATTRLSGQGRYQTAFKVIRTDGGRPKLSNEEYTTDQTPPKDRVDSFEIRCYYIDYDGRDFGPVGHTLDIQPFEGERDIVSLEAYPLEYAENHQTIRDQLKARGNEFKGVLDRKHMFYLGPTHNSDPNGNTSQAPKFVEHINSEVIIDFDEARKAGLLWIYNVDIAWVSENAVGHTRYEDEFTEDYPNMIWKDHDQKIAEKSWYDDIYNDDAIDIRESTMHLTSDTFLKTVTEIESELGHTSHEALSDDELCLLPSRVVGYVLRERKFAMLDVQHLRPIMPNPDGFESLKLPDGHKEMIQALVRSHSMKRDLNAASENSVDHDVVRGKGRGLIILLHGVPGVGKTSTAECIAESSGKPLFPITCGDLGLTAHAVEVSLRGIFLLAQAWDCVLLLDEADVFLARRDKTDLKRNAVVSVFLRVLEYYTGILFLTTNRVGAFDEAFKSRIHISLYYPPLGIKESVNIWEMNLKRTKKIDSERTKSRTIPAMIVDEMEIITYASQHYYENQNAAGKWNGRQIRNAFQTASALALYEAHIENEKRLELNPEAEPIPPRLKRKHLEDVAKATVEFDQYMEETIGKDDAKASHHRGDRQDLFTPKERPRQQAHPRPYGPRNTAPGPLQYSSPQSAHPPMSRTRQTPPRTLYAQSPRPRQYETQTNNVEEHTHTQYVEYDELGQSYDDEFY